MTNPLIDTLFRPTGRTANVASAAPVRVTGTRTRAGNAMSRTRAALLGGAAQAVEASGTKITMAQVAVAAGVAKATLYNHFRTREAVLGALVLALGLLVDDAIIAVEMMAIKMEQGFDRMKAAAFAYSSTAFPMLTGTLAALGRIDDEAETWRVARGAVADALAAAGRTGTDTVLRWLASFLLTPAAPNRIAADVAVLLAGLPTATSAETG